MDFEGKLAKTIEKRYQYYRDTYDATPGEASSLVLGDVRRLAWKADLPFGKALDLVLKTSTVLFTLRSREEVTYHA